MKITISDFGPIKKFEFDLDKDFIATYGKNNIGKSYAMQVVYLLLKNILGVVSSNYIFDFYKLISDNENEILSGIYALLDENDKDVDITDKINSIVENKLESVIGTILNTSYMNTFGDLSYLGGKDKSRKPRINIAFNHYNLDITIDDEVSFKNFNIRKKVFARSFQSHISIEEIRKDTSCHYSIRPEDISSKINEIAVQEMYGFFWAIKEHISDVYFLPASRSGIYSGMSAFGQIIAELSKNRSMLTKKIELPGISEPISDYFISLSNISQISLNLLQSDVAAIAKEIETKILKGEVRFDDNKKTLMYKPSNLDIELEMSSVSSMVSEMTPIVAFLKYILSKSKGDTKAKPIIFIEEPEAHLHPENQTKLIEIFAKLINYDVKLIMTSHSNYIFNKLNNLVMAKKLDIDRYCPIILAQTEEGSVSRLMDIDELGVNDENFVDVSEALYEEREEIIEQINLGVEPVI